jgi:hypothetical protein
MRNRSPAVLWLLLSLVSTRAADKKLTVEAGDFDRHDAVVTFTLPQATGQPHTLRRDGESIALQVEKDGRASFLIEDLKKGSRATYELVTDSPAGFADRIAVTRDKTKLKFSDASRPLIEYQSEPGALPRGNIKPIFTRGGYLHPIFTPAGKMISDDFPPNHIHHHGIWWAWTHTEFQGRKPDFWNMGEGKGRVEFVALDEQWSGPVHGGFRSRHRFVDLTAPAPVTVLNETWEVKVFSAAARAKWWTFELTSQQRCATADPLKLPEYHYGGLGLRGNRAWNGKDNCNFLTREGETDRVKGHGTRARWCDMWGELDGAKAGIAILCHPDNFRAPQPMRIHPSEPFFCYAPQQGGDMEIKPGDIYISRYRFVVHDGPPDKAELDRLWNDFAHPPVVTVGAETK